MAVLLANADGTVYHRYGGRAASSPMSMTGMVDIMRKGVETHRDYMKNPNPPPLRPPLHLPKLVNQRLKGLMKNVSGCFHCHYAREAKQLLALDEGRWTPDQFWIFPLPERIGLVMDQQQQYRVKKIIPQSAADRVGIKTGDTLMTLGNQRVLTKYDIQWTLDNCDGGAITLPFSLLRNGKHVEGRLSLESEWKVGDPRDYAWRVGNPFTAHMVKFLPTPGFIGRPLGKKEKSAAGLPQDGFALRVTSLNFGPHQAGVRPGDIILSAGGRTDFTSARDFYAWCEKLRREGRDIKMKLHRESYEMALMVSLNHLNYTRVEQAPTVDFGFVPQQLTGDGGLRVGPVADNSNAEKAGLKVGDRIVAVDGEKIRRINRLTDLLDDKSAGDLLMLSLVRQGKPFELSYVLHGESDGKSEIAFLSEKVTRLNQEMSCRVIIDLPETMHIYSAHKRGFGVPTNVTFRGRGYRLLGSLREPQPREIPGEDGESMWILDGRVELKQKIRITNPDDFSMVIDVYAQVCDDKSCHEFRAVLENVGSTEEFSEFRGDFHQLPRLTSDQ